MKITDIMQDASEIVHYDAPGIPLYIQYGILSDFPDMQEICHWHEDLELIYIIEGEMYYRINGNTILLEKEHSLVVNSRRLHYGYSRLSHECRFICILIHPVLFHGNPEISQKYIRPFVETPNIEYIHYNQENYQRTQMKDWLNRMYQLKKSAQPGYELEVLSILCLLWRSLYLENETLLQQKTSQSHSEVDLQKAMVSYIYEHYQEPLTLNEIASSGHISRSKCCQIFKHYLQQSPIDFLNKYRLEVSSHQLAHSKSSITQIALSCGFNNLSYFSKMFLREYGCTPTEYRKMKST